MKEKRHVVEHKIEPLLSRATEATTTNLLLESQAASTLTLTTEPEGGVQEIMQQIMHT